MAHVYPHIYLKDKLVASEEAQLHVASSAVLYGLSVYTVFNVHYDSKSHMAFRMDSHFKRLINSCRVIGIDTFDLDWDLASFTSAVKETDRPITPKRTCSFEPVFM